MIYHISVENTARMSTVVHKCKACDESFHSFYFLRELKRKERGAQRRSEAETVDVTQAMVADDDEKLKEGLKTCKRFLPDSKMKNGKHRVSIFAMDTLNPKFLLEKIGTIFESLKCATVRVIFCHHVRVGFCYHISLRAIELS